MIKKLRLSWSDAYQYAFAAQRAAEMLIAWLEGQSGPRLLASEHFEIGGWDDVVVEEADGKRIHYQVKQQVTDFDGSRPAKRRTKPQLATEDPDKDLNALDVALSKIADLSRDPHWDGWEQGHRRSFAIVLPHDNTHVKREIRLAQVCEFVRRCHKHGQNPEWFVRQAMTEAASRHIFDWLKSWCAFSDSAHIVRALRHVTILTIGVREEIEVRTESTLQRLFTEPVKARLAIRRFLEENADPSQATTPQLLLPQVSQYLNSTYRHWVLYHHDSTGPRWTIGGTLGTSAEHRASQSSSNEPVCSLWSTGDAPRELRVAASPGRCSLRVALLRLAAHADKCQTVVCLSDPNGWKERVGGWLGGTLGLSANDRVGSNWLLYSGTLSPVDHRVLDTGTSVEDEGKSLMGQMDEHTWRMIVVGVNERIQAYGVDALNASMEKIWLRWRGTLNANAAQASNLMSRLLMAEIERGRIIGELRVGPRTSDLLIDGILLLLAVSAALDADHGTWENIAGKSVHAVALIRFSDPEQPAGEPGSVSTLAAQLLSRETSSLVLLSGTDASPAELLHESLADDSHTRMSISVPHVPDMVFTGAVRRQARHRIDVFRKWMNAQQEKYAQARDAILAQSQEEALVA